jgi:hypothetical protein
MNEYTILLQTGAKTFTIKTYTATSKFRTYAKYRKDGIAVSILPNNDENYAYQYGLKLQMDNEINAN